MLRTGRSTSLKILVAPERGAPRVTSEEAGKEEMRLWPEPERAVSAAGLEAFAFSKFELLLVTATVDAKVRASRIWL